MHYYKQNENGFRYENNLKMKLSHITKHVNPRKAGDKKSDIKWLHLCKIPEIFCGSYLKLED